MAEDSDKDQKTEEPSEKRLTEAREEGQMPVSREMATWALFAAILAVVVWLGPDMARHMAQSLTVFLERPHELSLEGRGLQKELGRVTMNTLLASIFVFAILAFAVIAGTMVQTGFYVSSARLKLHFDRISPTQGLKQLLSMRSLVELGKGFVKLVVVGIAVYFIFKPLMMAMPEFTGHDLVELMGLMHKESVHLIFIILLIVTVIAVSDWLYQRHEYYSNLRMTKQEVKDEHKQAEGDPFIKGRLRQMRLEKARKRMMAQVPKADVVITNPTHFAVALKYDTSKMAAPVVLAKGADRVAERIREVAGEHAIPLVSNPPLARALFDTVEIDQAIKPEHYRAVAEVISYVYKMKKKR